MNETRALVLTTVVCLTVMAGSLLVLMSMGVTGEVLSLAFLLPLIAGSYVTSLIVMHYGESTRHRRR
jgi:hypothetical protein